MGASGILDGIENGPESSNAGSDESFDSMMNSLNLPLGCLGGGVWNDELECLGPIHSDDLQGGLASVPGSKFRNDTLDVLPSFSVPSNEASPPTQVLNFVEETSGASNTLHINSSAGLHAGVSQAPCPVSVLESSRSCSIEKSMPISSETVIPVCSRSNGLWPSTFEPCLQTSNPLKRKLKKKKKLSRLSGTTEMEENSSVSQLSGAMAMKGKLTQLHVETKKCTHCEATKTPQWREGPLGPKTLCNACGVRYRSGGLYPEYRPAASPTFVPSLHSNSHKKVIEMRNRTNHGAFTVRSDTEMDPPMSPLPEFVPRSYWLDFVQK